jgi:hypothetical protein
MIILFYNKSAAVMNSKIKYAGMALVAIAIYYLTIFLYCKVMNYYYSMIARVFTWVSYAVSQTNTILIVLICGVIGVFILYQSQKSNKENIAKLIRLQLFITAIWFTIPIMYDLLCYIFSVSYNWIPFLLEMGMVYITLAIWAVAILCFIHYIIRQKRKMK